MQGLRSEEMHEQKRRFELENYSIQDVSVQPKPRQRLGTSASSADQDQLEDGRMSRVHPFNRDMILRLIQTLKDR